jgi:hypothetical protein
MVVGPSVQQQQQQQSLLSLSQEARLAQLQQLQEQQMLQQQQLLQQLHAQQRQQLLQQQEQLQHQLVRLSIKLHGVTPQQLPSSTVQALEQLIVGWGSGLEAILLNPSVREGCLQLELDILVKPQLAGDGAGAAAEQQLCKALPFAVLLEALLDLPLLGAAPTAISSSSSSSNDGSDDLGSVDGGRQHPVSTSSTQYGWGSSGSSTDSSGSSSTDSSGPLTASVGGSSLDLSYDSSGPLPSSNSSQLLLDLSGDAATVAVGSSSALLSSRLTAVYAQLGSSLAVWTESKGLLHDWTPVRAGTGTNAANSSSNGSSGGHMLSQPQLQAAGPVCFSAAADASAGPAVGDAGQVQVGVTLQTGCRTEDVQLYCTSRGGFLPFKSTAAFTADAPAAAGSTPVTTQEHLGPSGSSTNSSSITQLLIELTAPAAPGLLLLQAEHHIQLASLLNSSSSSSSTTGDGGSGVSMDSLVDSQQGDPLPIKGSPLRILVCPSPAVTAEVSAVLLGGGVSSSHAEQLLQQLGLLMDYWTIWQQQQQLVVQQQLSARQQWGLSLLHNERYLGAIR